MLRIKLTDIFMANPHIHLSCISFSFSERVKHACFFLNFQFRRGNQGELFRPTERSIG